MGNVQARGKSLADLQLGENNEGVGSNAYGAQNVIESAQQADHNENNGEEVNFKASDSPMTTTLSIIALCVVAILVPVCGCFVWGLFCCPERFVEMLCESWCCGGRRGPKRRSESYDSVIEQLHRDAREMEKAVARSNRREAAMAQLPRHQRLLFAPTPPDSSTKMYPQLSDPSAPVVTGNGATDASRFPYDKLSIHCETLSVNVNSEKSSVKFIPVNPLTPESCTQKHSE